MDHFTYVLAGDGDMMEGITGEAASFAGHQKLGKLIVLYDDNHITIDGTTDLAFTEDVCKRYEAYDWHVQKVADGNDVDAIDKAIAAAKAETGRPSFIAVRTHIGFGSPNKQDTAGAHGAPLGDDEVKLTKEACGWPLEPTFLVADDVRKFYEEAAARGAAAHEAWRAAPRRLERGRPGARRRLGHGLEPRAAGRLGRRPAGVQAGGRGRGDALGLGQGDQRPRAARPDAHRRLRRPGAVQQHLDQGRGRTSRRRRRQGATSTSACASSAWRRSATAWPCTAASVPTWRRSSSSSTTCAPPCASPRSWACR